MVRVLFDDWPLLITEIWGTANMADLKELCAAYEKAFSRGGHFVSLVDFSGLEHVPSGELRHAYTRWRAAHVDDLQRHVLAVAHVVGDKRLLRASLAAMSWVVRHPAPELYFAEYSDAFNWACQQLPSNERVRRARDSVGTPGKP